MSTNYKERGLAMPVSKQTSLVPKELNSNGQYGISTANKDGNVSSPNIFCIRIFCFSACSSKCATECASNCGSECASKCATQCSSNCWAMCSGGSDTTLEELYDHIELINL